MEKLDLNLKERLARKPEGTIPVIITCKASCVALMAHLKAANIAVGEGLIELQMLTGTFSARQIETLAVRDDVEQISLDEEATTQ